jgi:excisionase family DNA binding protein
VSPAELTSDGRLVLDQRGAVIVAAALQVAIRAGRRDGVDFRHRSGAAEFAELLALAEAAAVAGNGHEHAPAGPAVAPWPRLSTTSAAAEVLGCSPRTVRRAIAQGSLRAHRAGHAWLVIMDGRPDAEPASGRRPAPGQVRLAGRAGQPAGGAADRRAG